MPPTAWVPDGKSFWEFGVNKNPQAKAEKDYAARVASVPAAERAKRDVRLRDAAQLAGQGGVAQEEDRPERMEGRQGSRRQRS